MTLNKLPGYIIAAIGLLGVVSSSGPIYNSLPFLQNLNSNYIIIISAIIIAIGVTFLVIAGKESEKSKTKQSQKEVPIYSGKGKKRKIVGYHRED
jgi:hypothetical protein